MSKIGPNITILGSYISLYDSYTPTTPKFYFENVRSNQTRGGTRERASQSEAKGESTCGRVPREVRAGGWGIFTPEKDALWGI